MREPPFLGILRPKREHVPRCKLLLARNLLTARKQAQNAVTLHSRTLQDQWLIQIYGFVKSVMLRLVSGIFV